MTLQIQITLELGENTEETVLFALRHYVARVAQNGSVLSTPLRDINGNRIGQAEFVERPNV